MIDSSTVPFPFSLPSFIRPSQLWFFREEEIRKTSEARSHFLSSCFMSGLTSYSCSIESSENCSLLVALPSSARFSAKDAKHLNAVIGSVRCDAYGVDFRTVDIQGVHISHLSELLLKISEYLRMGGVDRGFDPRRGLDLTEFFAAEYPLGDFVLRLASRFHLSPSVRKLFSERHTGVRSLSTPREVETVHGTGIPKLGASRLWNKFHTDAGAACCGILCAELGQAVAQSPDVLLIHNLVDERFLTSKNIGSSTLVFSGKALLRRTLEGIQVRVLLTDPFVQRIEGKEYHIKAFDLHRRSAGPSANPQGSDRD